MVGLEEAREHGEQQQHRARDPAERVERPDSPRQVPRELRAKVMSQILGVIAEAQDPTEPGAEIGAAPRPVSR